MHGLRALANLVAYASMRPLCSALVAIVMGLSIQMSTICGAQSRELLPNSGFEASGSGEPTTGTRDRVPGWEFFEQGYELSAHVRRTGRTAIECRNPAYDDRRGAVVQVQLKQTSPRPILVEGYSRAEGVGGFANNDYAIYVDLIYEDGTPLWGQTAPFSVGTHDWQRRRVLVWPAKPVREMRVYALFRHHTGTVWFDDFTARVLAPDSSFDGQAIAPPVLTKSEQRGWFLRDVAAGSPVLPIREAKEKLRLSARALRSERAGVTSLRVADLLGKPRCITVYYAERFVGKTVRWWSDIRRSVRCAQAGEYANLTRLGVGATGMQSLYPFACVTSEAGGLALGVPPADTPVVARFGYHAGSRTFYAAFDLALLPDTVANSADGRGHGECQVARWDVSPLWGFRSAASGYYSMFPKAFKRRATADGLWIPFADPAGVQNLEDFGIAYHEGDNSVESDDRLGILSFRYTEPMTWWMAMPPSEPRTYEAALALVNKHLTGSDVGSRRNAQAVVNSGSHDGTGRFNVEFQNAPWTNGAVWVLNPNPRLPAKAGDHTKASASFSPMIADRLYGAAARGVLDGEYLDSIEGWADVLDFRPESLRYSQACPTFTPDEHRPVVPTWFSVFEFAQYMRQDLERRGKLLMANATPWRLHAFSGLLDVMGTETNWMPGGVWSPDTDATFCLRRTLCYQKPYLLLQNTDFDKFGLPEVERYIQRCMFYAVFPSMFSVNASTRNYWTEPQWYNRDRGLFKRYVPVIKRLSKAGWEPITDAWTDDPGVYVERYGTEYIALLNETRKPWTGTVRINRGTFGKADASLKLWDEVDLDHVFDEVIGKPSAKGLPPQARFEMSLRTDECRVFRVAGVAAAGR